MSRPRYSRGPLSGRARQGVRCPVCRMPMLTHQTCLKHQAILAQPVEHAESHTAGVCATQTDGSMRVRTEETCSTYMREILTMIAARRSEGREGEQDFLDGLEMVARLARMKWREAAHGPLS